MKAHNVYKAQTNMRCNSSPVNIQHLCVSSFMQNIACLTILPAQLWAYCICCNLLLIFRKRIAKKRNLNLILHDFALCPGAKKSIKHAPAARMTVHLFRIGHRYVHIHFSHSAANSLESFVAGDRVDLAQRPWSDLCQTTKCPSHQNTEHLS